MQPLDLTVNKVVKDETKSSFINWYAKEVFTVLDKERADGLHRAAKHFQPDLKLSTLKPVHATWLIDVLSRLSKRPDLIETDWAKAMTLKPSNGLASTARPSTLKQRT